MAVDGTVRSTPFAITGEAIRNLSSKAAKAMVQDAAPDGNTATVTVTSSPGLTEGFSPGDVFGHVQLTRQMTVDLRPDVPVVTDVKLAQKLVP